jgi:hypothetical protein
LEDGQKGLGAERGLARKKFPQGVERAVVAAGGGVDQARGGVEQVSVAERGAGAEKREQLRVDGLARRQRFGFQFGGVGEQQGAVGVGGEVTAEQFAHGRLGGLGEELTHDGGAHVEPVGDHEGVQPQADFFPVAQRARRRVQPGEHEVGAAFREQAGEQVVAREGIGFAGGGPGEEAHAGFGRGGVERLFESQQRGDGGGQGGLGDKAREGTGFAPLPGGEEHGLEPGAGRGAAGEQAFAGQALDGVEIAPGE